MAHKKRERFKEKILITGAAGFIGSHLCRKLVQNPDNWIVGLDDLSSGSYFNIEPLVQLENFTWKNRNIAHGLYTHELSQVYNLACTASPAKYQKDPIHTLDSNIMGIRNILQFAAASVRIVQASTSEIYGDPRRLPMSEFDYTGRVSCYGPRACYDEGKRAVEAYIWAHQITKNRNCGIARIFNTYGPGMDIRDGRVVPNFITQALKNEPITIYGKGEQTRSFCYIDDTIDGLIKLMDSNYQFPVNIGNIEQIKIKDLADLIIKKIDSKSEIVYMDLPIDDPMDRLPDIKTAYEQLNWKPKVSLEEGLERTIEYYEKTIG